MTEYVIKPRHLPGGELIRQRDASISHGANIDISANVTLGNGVVISQDAVILTHEHSMNDYGTVTKSPLFIRDHVFIGIRAIITAGCNAIGKNAYIGAGAVVTCDIPDNAIVKGNPAMIVGYKKNHDPRTTNRNRRRIHQGQA